MKKTAFLIDIFLWIIIAVLLIAGGWHFYKSLRPDNTISVEFGDINSLDIGAPVNFMGVRVGSVKSFDIIDDKVKVTFYLNYPGLKIPDGSVMSIQFTGLVGSKSLEIEPSLGEKPAKGQKYITKDPIRISSFIEMSAKTSESIASGSENFLTILGGEGTIAMIKDKIYKISIMAHNASQESKIITEIVRDARIATKDALEDANRSVDKYVHVTDIIVRSMNTRDYHEDTRAIMRYIQLTLLYFYYNLKESNYQRTLSDIIFAGESINRRFDFNILIRFSKIEPEHAIEYLDKLDLKIIKAGNSFEKIYNAFKSSRIDEIFKNIIDKTEALKNITRKMESAI